MTKRAKPRITRFGDQWLCDDGRYCEYSWSPYWAYHLWEAKRRQIEFYLLPPDLPAKEDAQRFWRQDLSKLSVFEWVLILAPVMAIAWFSIRAIL